MQWLFNETQNHVFYCVQDGIYGHQHNNNRPDQKKMKEEEK
jgi:hypothetical protein